MIAEERAEYERREAIRMARFEAFCVRTLEAQRAAEAESRRVLEERLHKNARQPELGFVI